MAELFGEVIGVEPGVAVDVDDHGGVVPAGGPVGGLSCGGKHIAAALAARLRSVAPSPCNGVSIP